MTHTYAYTTYLYTTQCKDNKTANNNNTYEIQYPNMTHIHPRHPYSHSMTLLHILSYLFIISSLLLLVVVLPFNHHHHVYVHSQPSAAAFSSFVNSFSSVSDSLSSTFKQLQAPTVATTTTTTPSSTSITDIRQPFIGQWLPLPTCTASPTCCCGNGITAITNGGTSNTIIATGGTTGMLLYWIYMWGLIVYDHYISLYTFTCIYTYVNCSTINKFCYSILFFWNIFSFKRF
jgi:competence protein ComGC